MRSTPRQPVGVRVRDALPDAQVFGAADVYATSCSCDAHRTRPGDVYFALDADASDACERARIAAQRGAAAIVVDRLTPVFGTPQYLTHDARDAFGAFCQHMVGDPSRRLRVTGIAGAHGKSSVATLLAAVLTASARGDANQPAGCLTSGAQSDGTTTTPCDAPITAPRVARWLSECVVDGCHSAVAAIGNRALAERSFAGVTLDTLCLTNTNFDPPKADRSPGAARRLAAQSTELLSPAGVLVANADDPGAMRVVAEASHAAITFGVDQPAEVSGRVLETDSGRQLIAVTTGHETALVESSIIGAAHAQNCLAAIAAALTQGVDLATAARGVERVTRLPGVVEPLPCGQPFPVYLDRGASAERLRASLSAVRRASPERLIAVLPEGADATVQAVAASLSDLAIAPGEFRANVDRAANVRSVEDRFSALALALALADAGDAVVVTGAGRTGEQRHTEETTVRELLAMRLAQPEEAVAAL